MNGSLLQDQFVSATPVLEGRGMQLLMKMGWKPGQGIGKNNDGQLEPLTLDVKQDRRGRRLAFGDRFKLP